MVNYLDLTIVLILFICAMWGLMRGFTKTIRKSLILVVTISALICIPLGNALYTTGMGQSLQQSLTASIGEAGGELLSSELYYIDGTYYLGGATLDEAIQTVEGSKVVKAIMLLMPMILKGKESLFVDGGKSFLEITMPVLTKLILIAIAFVVIIIVIKLILMLIDHFLKAVFDKIKIAKWLDRLLGSLLALAKGALFVMVGMAVVSFVAGMDIQGIELLVNQINTSVIGKWIIDTNVLNILMAQVIGGIQNA